MNIFYLDHNPNIAAQYHCDKHVVKMILESAQMLSVAQRVGGNKNEILYGGFPNHPCTKWVCQSVYNYEWLLDLFLGLCVEYGYRYGKVHKTYDKLSYELSKVPKLSYIEYMPPPQCMPEIYKSDDTVKSYRNYYINEKTSICKWTKRPKPEWWVL